MALSTFDLFSENLITRIPNPVVQSDIDSYHWDKEHDFPLLDLYSAARLDVANGRLRKVSWFETILLWLFDNNAHQKRLSSYIDLVLSDIDPNNEFDEQLYIYSKLKEWKVKKSSLLNRIGEVRKLLKDSEFVFGENYDTAKYACETACIRFSNIQSQHEKGISDWNAYRDSLQLRNKKQLELARATSRYACSFLEYGTVPAKKGATGALFARGLDGRNVLVVKKLA